MSNFIFHFLMKIFIVIIKLRSTNMERNSIITMNEHNDETITMKKITILNQICNL